MAQPSRKAFENEEPAAGRVLIADDQPELRRLFRRDLTRAGYTVVEASDGCVALALAQQMSFDVVVSDVRMPDMTGIELLQALSELAPDLPVVLTSGSLEGLEPFGAREIGAFSYLVKPVSFDTMRAVVAQAIEVRRARAFAKELFEPYRSVERLKVPGPRDDDDDESA